MGSITYNFLVNSFFFNEDSINDEFVDFSDEKIYLKLEAYRNHCLSNFKELQAEISRTKSTIKVFATIDDISISYLTQTALYIEQFIISDPLFKLTEKTKNSSEAASMYLGFENTSLNRKKLSNTLRFLKNITPFIAEDFVKLLPYNILFEAPDAFPIKMSTNLFSDVLPAPILNFFRDKAIVSPTQKLSSGGYAIMDSKLKPCRAIHVCFDEMGTGNGMLYFLMQTKVTSFDKNTGRAEFIQTLPDTPPDTNQFDAWVTQSINQAAKVIFDKIWLEASIAAKLNSTYLCNSRLSSELLTQNVQTSDSLQSFTANELMQVDLPFLRKISPSKIMQIRNNEAEVFTNFRLELERNFREMRGLKTLDEINLHRENIWHELNEVQVAKINAKMSQVKRQIGINSSIMFGSLLASSITNGFSLLALIHTIAKGYSTYNDYINDVKLNPSFLLWKLKQNG